MKINLVLPAEYVLEKLPTDKSQELISKLIQFVKKCEERIVSIHTNSRVKGDIREEVLPKLTNLKNIKIVTSHKIAGIAEICPTCPRCGRRRGALPSRPRTPNRRDGCNLLAAGT